MLHRHIERHFPSLQERITVMRLQSLTLEQLDQLVTDIFDLKTDEELLAWFAKHRLDSIN